MPLINPALPQDGDDITATSVNTPVSALISLINGNLDHDNFVDGGIATADLANGAITGVKIAVGAIQIDRVTISAQQNLTGSLADLTGMTSTKTIDSSGRPVEFKIEGTFEQDTDANSNVNFALLEDGSSIYARTVPIHRSGVNLQFNLFFSKTPAAGSHTYKVQASYSSGGGTPYIRTGSTLTYSYA